MVFPRPINDKKAALSFQRTLEAYETYPILRVIWKESPYVTDSELEASGYMRSFRPGTLTCHGFAERIAESDTDVGKVNKRIRTIVDASSAYGLIEKQKVGLRKKNLLVGSEFLHEFMVELSKMHERILDGKRGSVLTEVNQS
jgi:hypothetical protein